MVGRMPVLFSYRPPQERVSRLSVRNCLKSGTFVQSSSEVAYQYMIYGAREQARSYDQLILTWEILGNWQKQERGIGCISPGGARRQ